MYLLQSYEGYVREGQGVVMAGMPRDPTFDTFCLSDAISFCNDQGAFWFLDHPFSVGVPVIAFRYPTHEEFLMRERWFETYDPPIEVGNHQNTLWMYPSNVLAQRAANRHGLARIANSDTHFRIKEVGLSRTGIFRALLDFASEDAFFSSLRTAFSREHRSQLLIESGYSSLLSFGTYMILPRFLPKKLQEESL